MDLSVAYTFEPGIIGRLARFPEVKEIYGKLDRDCIGGGRSTYTLRRTSHSQLKASIDESHRCGIAFNYLINAANLGGVEQTRAGQKRIRNLLEMIDDVGADCVTVSAPYLLRVVKRYHPRLKVRVGVFAVVDSAEKARQWEDLGADTLCVSAIACNRNFELLRFIRQKVKCNLQLIVNASCLPACAYELTHMNLLTQSSRKGDALGGFCLDYCILHCSSERIKDPSNYLKSVWIRPEDLSAYENIGYHSFKIVERSCPGDLLIRRVEAYANRTFDGNLFELVAPVAQIKREQGTPLSQRLRMIATMAKPWRAKLKALLLMKKYGELIIPHKFDRENAPVYIDNRALDGFLEGMRDQPCGRAACTTCTYCRTWATRAVTVKNEYREEVLELAGRLDEGLVSGSHWL